MILKNYEIHILRYSRKIDVKKNGKDKGLEGLLDIPMMADRWMDYGRMD